MDEQYKSLSDVLDLAYARASEGKGAERHADGRPFEEQDICSEMRYLGVNPAIFQARKKVKEVTRLSETERKINEFLDAIVYCAAAVIILQEEPKPEEPKEVKKGR